MRATIGSVIRRAMLIIPVYHGMVSARKLAGVTLLGALLGGPALAENYNTAIGEDTAPWTTHTGTADAHHAKTVDASELTTGSLPAARVDGVALTPTTRVQSYTGNQTLSATDTHCSVVTNDGATGGITLTLPEAATGLCVLVILVEAQDVDVDPQGAIDCSLGAGCDQIIGETNQPGELLSSDATVGSLLSLVGLTADEWIVTGKAGTWTPESP